MLKISRARRERPPAPARRKTKQEIVESFRLETIEDAAIAVIARKGLADTTMQEIAEAAGIAKGTIYLYFRNRDELVAKIAERAFQTLLEDVEKTFKSPGTLEERLTMLVLHPLEFVDQNAELLMAALALAEGESARSDARARMQRRYREKLEALFTEAKSRGEMRDLDCDSLAALFMDCVRGVISRRVRRASRPSREEEAEFVVSVLLRGIRP